MNAMMPASTHLLVILCHIDIFICSVGWTTAVQCREETISVLLHKSNFGFFLKKNYIINYSAVQAARDKRFEQRNRAIKMPWY